MDSKDTAISRHIRCFGRFRFLGAATLPPSVAEKKAGSELHNASSNWMIVLLFIDKSCFGTFVVHSIERSSYLFQTPSSTTRAFIHIAYNFIYIRTAHGVLHFKVMCIQGILRAYVTLLESVAKVSIVWSENNQDGIVRRMLTLTATTPSRKPPSLIQHASRYFLHVFRPAIRLWTPLKSDLKHYHPRRSRSGCPIFAIS